MELVGVPHDAACDRDPGPVIGDAIRAALALAEVGVDAVRARRHLVGDLLLDAALDDRVRWSFVRPELESIWRVLAEVLPEPAGARARDLARWCAATPNLPRASA